ncbi:hypothetical protein CMUS01_13719 [Colletotrichum musicola]|uniref:Uncharacterized protein n=1 Tax=Colletotrichum musicola TaxID=2175873 RepID=A0A8H6JB17_9PEZI|nr:hypothetical protein CMUS01_13719 [Colletotrichum musicola]
MKHQQESRPWLIRLAERIPGFKRHHKMAETDGFHPNNTIIHRYADAKVLLAELLRFKFDKKQIVIRADNENGFQIQLPRQLNDVSSVTLSLDHHTRLLYSPSSL